MSRLLNVLMNIQAKRPGRPVQEANPLAAIPPGATAPMAPEAASFVRFYGLKENPFADAIDLDYYYKTAAHESAYLKMRATVEDGISLGLVTGPAGSGKTIISQLLLRSLDPGLHRTALVLVSPGMGKSALLAEMLREAGMTEAPRHGRSRLLLEALHELILDLGEQGRRLTVLIDEAHFLTSEALHMLRTVSNLEAPKKKLTSCLLFAEDRFRRRLAHPSHRSLATRMYHRVGLEPMEPHQSEQYLRFRLMVAGGDEGLFDDEACRMLARKSGGICREVNRLGYLSLTEGFVRGRRTVTADLVEAL